MYLLKFSLSGFFLVCLLVNVFGAEEVSLNYIYDYSSNVELKTVEKEYSFLLNYTGNVETSAYILTDERELVFVKLNIDNDDGSKIKRKSAISVVLRRKGLVERMVVDSGVDNGILNLLKGIVNLLNIDEMRRNKTEGDVNGECEVMYKSINEELLIREKVNCNKTTFTSPITDIFDSFSIYHEPTVKIHYRFNNNGVLVAVDSLETHLLESVLTDELSQTFRSTTSLLFNKIVQSETPINFVSVDHVIKGIFGNKHKDVFLVAVPEVMNNEPMSDKVFLAHFQQIIKSYKVENRAQKTMELMKLLRRTDSRILLKKIVEEKEEKEMVHEAFIACGTKICSEIAVSQFDHCLIEDRVEANRMLLLMQHVSFPGEYMIHAIWKRVTNVSEEVYDQWMQTVTSLIQRVQDVKHMEPIVKAVMKHVQNKLTSCIDDQCLQVHLGAIKNTRLPEFHKILLALLKHNGNYSQAVVANIFGSLCSLNYDNETKVQIRQLLFEMIKREINFYTDSRVKSEAIFCLVRLESDTEDIVNVINLLKGVDDHFNVFLTKKFRELINMGILKDGELVLESEFFRRQNHHHLTYKDASNMLVNQMMTSKSLYSDIHFNIIGEDGGVVRNSMTDIFLVTTASENHLFSLATHISGLQSIAGITGNSNDEVVEGLLQLVLFGKEARPIKLFHGTSQLMSAIWYAPSELESLLRGTFFPINIHKEITLQNGIVLMLNYEGSTYLDFLFRLNSNLWYKTADSLMSVMGQAYINMEIRFGSLGNKFNFTQNLSLKSGLDFETNVDFSSTPVKNCLSVSRTQSQLDTVTVLKKRNTKMHSKSSTEIEGSCYSLSKLTDQVCSTF